MPNSGLIVIGVIYAHALVYLSVCGVGCVSCCRFISFIMFDGDRLSEREVVLVFLAPSCVEMNILYSGFVCMYAIM